MRFQELTWAMWALLLASIRAMHMEEKFQESLLRQLQLSEIPVLEKADVEHLVIPDHVRTKYVSLMKRSAEEPSPRGKRHSRTIAEIMGRIFSDASNQMLVFSMKNRLPPTRELVQAVLRLFQKPSPKGVIRKQHKMFPFHSYASVTIYWVQVREDGTNRTYVIDSRRVSMHETGWITFDVSQAVNYWQQEGKVNQPLFNLLLISMQRSHLNWILDPPGFKAYDCVGSCQQLKKEHLNFRWPFAIQRKCHVTSTAPLPLIVAVKEGDKIVTKVVNLHNMKVMQCSCSSEGMPVMKKLKP
uniref:TGF-beta family profile domain-containing protein n=1 Tax=Vombatus ursinus TaxID=29139 RepID=A0A4X2LB65_VOMUR